MTNINDEMKSTAYYAIKVAKERFSQELDFSEQSISTLDDILVNIYWGFSNHSKDEGKNGLIINTALIWGSYLGEYMRLKWGGTWILKGSDRLVSIENNQLSPISFVYQKITSQLKYKVDDYLFESKIKISLSVDNPQPSQHPSERITQSKVDDYVLETNINELTPVVNPQPLIIMDLFTHGYSTRSFP